MGLFDFVDSIFDPVSGSGFGSDLLDFGFQQVLGGFTGQPAQQVMAPVYYPPAPQPQAQPVGASVPMAARAIAAGLPAWSARFPSLWQAISRLRAQGSKLSVDKLIAGLRRWGPAAMTTMLGAQAVAELVSYSMTRKRRRMNPANARALRRSMRRLKAFDNLSHRVSAQLAGTCRTKRKRKC